ncbi:MAG: hypothetical protein QOJ62_1684, partial [Actinomycetota bacterium]|nr:hypothetical protein [Actinomycetota bacterium]
GVIGHAAPAHCLTKLGPSARRGGE